MCDCYIKDTESYLSTDLCVDLYVQCVRTCVRAHPWVLVYVYYRDKLRTFCLQRDLFGPCVDICVD